MYFVHNDYYQGGCRFDTLKEAVYHARRLQRLAYRAGIITNTTIFADTAQYNFGLHIDAYRTSTLYRNDVSTRLSNILMRKSCQTIAQAVALGAGINSGFVNPWKIRDLGKQTLNELHSFNRRCICDVHISRKVYNDKYFLGYVLEG